MSDPAASLASMTTLDFASDAGVRACARRSPASYAFVSADVITGQEAAAYEQALATAPDERSMQLFLEAVPRLLVQHLNAGDGYWIIPQKQLGSEHVTDFLIAEPGSTGLTWYAVELKRPQAKIFTAKGDPSAALTHALRQIDDWRDWLSRNRDYASRPREQSGLGLPDIDPELDGLVIMGRDAQLDPRSDALRRRLQRQHRVRIETYDWLARQARSRLAALERSRPARDDGPQDAAAASPEDTPAPARLVRDAVEAVFGGIGHMTEQVIVKHTAGLGFVTVAYGEGDEDRELIPVNIVDAYRPDGVLPFLDWDLWWNAANDLDAWGSLMVSELVPLAELQQWLTPHRPGVWIRTLWGQWPDDEKPSLGKLDVLVHLPPSAGQHERVSRLTAARELFYAPEPALLPDPERVIRLTEEADRAPAGTAVHDEAAEIELTPARPGTFYQSVEAEHGDQQPGHLERARELP
jgi:hypothetical protein